MRAHAPVQPICPATDTFRARPPSEKKKDQKRVARCACSCRAEPMLGLTDGPESSRAWARLYEKWPARLPLLLIFFSLPWVTGHRNLSEVGRVGCAGVSAAWARGMPRAGWAGRPTPVLPCAQDSAHEQAAAKPPGTDSRRPPRTQLDRPARSFCFQRPTQTHPRGAAPLAGNYNPMPASPSGSSAFTSTAACVRLWHSSFFRIAVTCTFTVFSANPSV